MVKLSTLKDKIKKKKKLGFTERASAIARGLLPRSPRRVQNRLSIHDSRPDRRTRL